jgi:hypothetical protein
MWSGLDGNEPTISRGQWQIFEKKKTVTNWRNFGLNKPRNLTTNFNCLSDVLWYTWLMTYCISHFSHVQFRGRSLDHHCCLSQNVQASKNWVTSHHSSWHRVFHWADKCADAIAAPKVSFPLVQKLGTVSYSSTVFSESAIYYRLIPDISTTDSLTMLTLVMGRFRELLLQIWKTVTWGRENSQLVQIKYTSNNVQCPL